MEKGVIYMKQEKDVYEAYRMEVKIRKEKYQKEFEETMKQKADTWSDIYKRHIKKEHLTNEDYSFMLNEIAYSYNSYYSESIPYLKGHFQRLYNEFINQNRLKAMKSLTEKYFEAVDFIMEKKLAVFGRKKVIDSCIDKAKEVLKETEELFQEATLFINSDYQYEDKWEKEKRRWEILDHQLTIHRPYLDRDIKWMIAESRYSIEEQVNTGKLFFMHRMDRLEKERIEEQKVEDFKKVVKTFQVALEKIATEPIPLLDTGQHLDRMKNHLRNAREECQSAYIQARGYLEEEQKQ